jgi:retinol dehydrogenase-12
MSLICVKAVFAERHETAIFPALSLRKNQPDRYNTSKLLEVLIVRELGSATSKSDKPFIIINCLTPGLCESQLMRHASVPLAFAARIGKILLGRSTEVGSRNLFASSVAGKESHGKYMADCNIAEPSAFVGSLEGAATQKRIYEELLQILERIIPGISKTI